MTQTIRYKYVPIKADTKVALDELGKKGTTYDELVRLLISKWREEN